MKQQLTLSEFLDGPFTYILPAPGGAIEDGKSTTCCVVDSYLATIAAELKRAQENDRLDILVRRITQATAQRFYGAELDKQIIDRMTDWSLDLAARQLSAAH